MKVKEMRLRRGSVTYPKPLAYKWWRWVWVGGVCTRLCGWHRPTPPQGACLPWPGPLSSQTYFSREQVCLVV